MAYTIGPIQAWHRDDTTPTSAEGGYAGAASTAAAVGTSLDQSGKALGTVDNLAVTASTLDYGQEATATISGTSPWKTIHVGIPKGMSEDAAQGILTEAQSAATSSQTSADAAALAVDAADVAATRAENAEGVALAPAAEVIADTFSNSTTAAVQRAGVLTPVTIDHAGVQAALNSAASFGLRVQTAGEYTTDQTLTIAGDCDLSGLTITYTGTGTAVRVAAATSYLRYASISLPSVVHGGNTQDGWAQVVGTIGVDLVNLLRCNVVLPLHVTEFETGVRVLGDDIGNSYNTYHVGFIANNKVNLHLHGAGVGWCNENIFIGGRCSHYSGEAEGGSGAGMTGPAPGTRHLLLSSSSPEHAGPNSNKFYGLSLENVGATEYAADFDNAGRNMLDMCRWEAHFAGMSGQHPRVRIGAVANENVIRGGYDAHRIQVTVAAGGSLRGCNIESAMGSRLHFADLGVTGPGKVGGWIVDNVSSVSAPVLTVMRPSWEVSGDDPATAWMWRWSGAVLAGKKDTDAHPRFSVDANTGSMLFGNGAVAPVAGLTGTSTHLRSFTSLNPSSTGQFDLGASSLAWRDVNVSRYVGIGSLLLRDNGGVLEVYAGGTWKTVNLT